MTDEAYHGTIETTSKLQSRDTFQAQRKAIAPQEMSNLFQAQLEEFAMDVCEFPCLWHCFCWTRTSRPNIQ